MEGKISAALKEDFHSINNLLNKITTHAGMAKYRLEKDGIDLKNIKDEKAHIIKIMDNMEENAMKIGEILKRLRKDIA